MREELRQLWTRTNVSAEQLVVDLQAWCKKAEDSGIAALQEFSLKLRARTPEHAPTCASVARRTRPTEKARNAAP